MKRFLFFPLFVVIITASISISFVGCENQPVEPLNKEEAQSLSKAIVYDESWTIDFDDDTDPYYPYIYYDCENGIEYQQHGKILAQQKVRKTPSGHTIWNGNVDYNYYDPITLSGSDGSTWTLYKGLNPFHDMVKFDPELLIWQPYKLTYKIHEFYMNDETGDKLKILIEGTFKISEDGTEYWRENFKCLQKPK